jgi:hypothetical protein
MTRVVLDGIVSVTVLNMLVVPARYARDGGSRRSRGT